MALPQRSSVKLWLSLLYELELAGGASFPRTVIPRMRRYFPEITDHDLTLLNAETRQNAWENRVHWIRNDSVQSGLIDGSTRGVWRITPEGTKWLHRYWRGADADYGHVPHPPKIEGSRRERSAAPPRAMVQASRPTVPSLKQSPALGAAMGKIVARTLSGAGVDLDCLDYYLVACMGHELGRFGDALRLLDTALAGGLDGDYRGRAEQLRAVCMLKAEE